MTARPFGWIYVVTHAESGKFYIGQTQRLVSSRWSIHKSNARRGQRTVFYNALRCHGFDAFTVHTLTSASSLAELNRLETLWIVVTGAYRRDFGYNQTFGGDQPQRTDESRARQGSLMRGRKASPETRARMSAARKGRPHSAQHSAAISRSLMGHACPKAVSEAVTASNLRRAQPQSTNGRFIVRS